MDFTFHTYGSIHEILFSNIKLKKTNVDFVEHFFISSYKANVKRHLRSGRINFQRKYAKGPIAKCEHLLVPTKHGYIERNGHELFNSLLDYFNNEYWIVALWFTMYEHNKDSVLGREIVRAFMKNCIKQTAYQVSLTARTEITPKNIDKWMLHKLEFYNQVFNVNNIYQNIRKPYKSKLKNHTKKNSASDLTKQLVNLYQDGHEDEIELILKEHGMTAFLPLIEFSQFNIERNHINGIGDTFKLVFQNYRKKNALRSNIKEVTAADCRNLRKAS